MGLALAEKKVDKDLITVLHKIVPFGISLWGWTLLDFNIDKVSDIIEADVGGGEVWIINVNDLLARTNEYPLKIFLYEEHGDGVKRGRAIAEILKETMIVKEDGLYAKLKWIDKEARDLVAKGILNYYSPEVLNYKNEVTGELIFPVLGGLGLTNKPHFKQEKLKAELKEKETVKVKELSEIAKALKLKEDASKELILEKLSELGLTELKLVESKEDKKEDGKKEDKKEGILLTGDTDELSKMVIKLSSDVAKANKTIIDLQKKAQKNDLEVFLSEYKNRIPLNMLDNVKAMYLQSPDIAENLIKQFPEFDGILLSENLQSTDELTFKEKKYINGNKKLEDIIKKGKRGIV